MNDDVDDMMQNDTKMVRNAVRNYRNGGGMVGGLGAIVEGMLWSLSAFSILFMVVSMPWVGQGKPIPGQTWIGASVGGIVVFGCAAGIARYLRRYSNAGGLNEGVEMNRGRGGGRR